MIALDASTMIGSKERPWFHVLQLNVERDVASEYFPVEPVVADEPGLGNADYWFVEYECGLKVGFEFFHLSSGASVYADLPTPHHARRHLRHWNGQLADIPPEMWERDRNSMIEMFESTIPELREPNNYQVWRQGDDGNPMPVGSPTTKRDADCCVQELESHGHKQLYWCSLVSH